MTSVEEISNEKEKQVVTQQETELEGKIAVANLDRPPVTVSDVLSGTVVLPPALGTSVK
ncbi:2586_t:CDS:1, partial [Acaulospora colombiana]